MPLINFDYPVVDFRLKTTIGCLRITAMVVLREDKTIAGAQPMKVMYGHENVMQLIHAISPDEFDSIQAAVNNHAEYLYGDKEETLLETLGRVMMPTEKDKAFLNSLPKENGEHLEFML